MSRSLKILCGILAVFLMVQSAVIPANALDIQITTHKSSGYVNENGTYVAHQVPSYNEVPLYLQTDYPDTRYGSGTITAEGGCCGITAMENTGNGLRCRCFAVCYRSSRK